MARISKIDPDTAPEDVREAIRIHLSQGRKLTNEKLTLLHNVNAFNAVEAGSYRLDDDLQRLIGSLDGDLYEYAISVSNDCLVCTTYFAKLLREKYGLDPNTFHLTKRQEMLMQFARKMGHDPKSITDEEFEALKKEFLVNGGKDGKPVTEEQAEEIMVVLVAMGAMMVANNYVNDALRVDA
ncbi:MAG: carboxymuconolactone decarboxylase family protein [Lachnospiraceae bacterium]|jgi:hypothetical protein